MIKFCMYGAAGKMGKQIIHLASKDNAFKLVGACDKEKAISTDIEELSVLSSNLEDCLRDAQVMIDFTSHDATVQALSIAEKMHVPVVIGTTGFNDKEEDRIRVFAQKLPCVKAPNMSIGINLLFKICQEATKILGSDYDVEVVEAHHRWKKDAPSGTAVRFVELIASAKGVDLKGDVVNGRSGDMLKRTSREIGVHAIRAGDIVGDHTILFGGDGERIELTHRAHSRETFARGALRAAQFVVNAKPGLYDMQDVLRLKV